MNSKIGPIKATGVFHQCPLCGSEDLIAVQTECLCTNCDWDSTFWSSESGLMDDVETAAREWFGEEHDEDYEYLIENSNTTRKGA